MSNTLTEQEKEVIVKSLLKFWTKRTGIKEIKTSELSIYPSNQSGILRVNFYDTYELINFKYENGRYVPKSIFYM